jgi:hypothetical protein
VRIFITTSSFFRVSVQRLRRQLNLSIFDRLHDPQRSIKKPRLKDRGFPFILFVKKVSTKNK